MTDAFISVVGQNDNLGDSVLRRGYVRAFQDARPSTLHVRIASHDDAYLSALGLTGEEKLYRSGSEWQKAFVRSMGRGRVVLGHAAGEIQVRRDAGHLGWSAVARLLAVKLRGGTGVHAGLGIRDPHAGAPASTRAALKLCRVVSWRDQPSRDGMGFGLVNPDWAFWEGSDAEVLGTHAGRDLLTVSMRGDREDLSDAQITGLRDFADAHGLRVQAVSQVVRDAERTRDLARRLGSDLDPITMGDESHADWESVMRDIYRRTAMTVSDRLHVLVMGATEGAIPFAFSGSSTAKSIRTLAAGGITTAPEGDVAAQIAWAHQALSAPDAVATAVLDARRSLVSLRGEIARTMGN